MSQSGILDPDDFSTTIHTKKPSKQYPEDLWNLARDQLTDKERQALGSAGKTQCTADIIKGALGDVKKKQEEVEKNHMRIKTKHGERELRQYVDKIANMLNSVVAVGDTVVQFDPAHAALPWAGVRLLLGAAVNDSNSFRDMAEGLEFVSTMIARYHVVERVYLHEESGLKEKLKQGIVKLYAAILRYLGVANAYYGKSKISR
ncbi:hypothetical protein E4T42_05815 [Aureobasidium subglaciale]|nr:hypothetical protein E4T42_05815 [Aureobasidium subglaciale]